MPRLGVEGKMWQRVLSPDIGEIDPEHEKELRLVAQARAGAAWALSALVARYQPPVVRYLVRLTGSAERGRSLAEDVLVRMAKRVRGPHGGDHLRLWLLRAATEAGLDALRHPHRADPRRLGEAAGPVALIAGRVGDTSVGRWVAGWGTRIRQQAEPRPNVRTQQFIWQESAETPAIDGEEHDQLEPREALKYRMVRAVLAELPYGDAQCLSLHLVAGLNQTEVAQALGIAPAVARRRIVQGLQLFGRRYEAALAGLGLSPDFDSAQGQAAHPGDALPSGAPETAARAASSLGTLATAGVVDADTGTQPSDPAAGVPARASASEMALPIVRLASPTAAPHPEAMPLAPEAESAEERALTSAAIMAYLRTAAANVRSREQVRAFVEADWVPTPPPHTVEPIPAAGTDQRRDATGADSTGDDPPQPVVQGDVLAIGKSGIAPDSNEEESESGTASDDFVESRDAMAATASGDPARHDEARHELTDGVTLAKPLREPRLIPVFDPVAVRTGEPEPVGQSQLEPVGPDAFTQPEPPIDVDSGDQLVEFAGTPAATKIGDDAGATVAEETLSGIALPTASDFSDSTPAGPETVTADDNQDALDAAVASNGLDAETAEVTEAIDGTDHYMLVVEAEPNPPPDEPRLRLLRARRTQVLSADGEAEDPSDAAIWPVS